MRSCFPSASRGIAVLLIVAALAAGCRPEGDSRPSKTPVAARAPATNTVTETPPDFPSTPRLPPTASAAVVPAPDDRVPVTPRPSGAMQWPPAATWRTRVTGDADRAATFDFSMRLVGSSPEFRYLTLDERPRANALVLGRGLMWWQEGRVLGLRYRSVSPEAVMPPSIFSEGFPSQWSGRELGLETVDRQAALHYQGSIHGKDWDLWLSPSLQLPPLKMSRGTLIYQNSLIEIGSAGPGDSFSLPAGVEFEGPGDDWKGPPAFSGLADSDEPMTVTGDVQPPVLIRKVEPAYPAGLRQARISGVVVVEAVIGKDGVVRDARVIRSANPALDEEVLKAVRLWIYKPATLMGKPVTVYLTMTTTFSLH